MEQISTVGYQENGTDVHAVGELAQDVRDAVIEYQVSSNVLVIVIIHCLITVQFGQQNAIQEQNCRLIVSHMLL